MERDKCRRAMAIFAHNEEKNIIKCLESVSKAIRNGDECVILNNGSSDNTGALVEEFIACSGFGRLVTINFGDKANAWNVFVHDIGIDAEVFFFLDGDCEIEENSLDALEECIVSNPRVNAAAALPSAKVSPKNRAAMIRDGGLAGNLYALSDQFVERVRKHSVRLPIGLIGDDSLIGALAYWDLNPRVGWDITKIAVCKEAVFSYVPLSCFSISDLRLYYRRKIRYSLRYFQTELMKKPLKEYGLEAIPESVEKLYVDHISEVRVTRGGIDALFDYLAAREIRKCILLRKA
ncbi:MAG: glycosyltransferase family 2 protein [Candidatus Accumulibacter sp.]|uniref:Glycosyltransferase family 2 protein n=1 Tax=Candidatus Accumulibacter proximus TaxID=2954385 RepID=A0A935PY52_9PROT|nr:glycosyltransferase family 2 protein [Candidatus Accumulibacter proximus]